MLMNSLKYLFVIIDNDVPSFCFYSNHSTSKSVRMSLEMLKDIIFFAMKENLIVNFIVGKKLFSMEYMTEINKVHHIMISDAESQLNDSDDILVVYSGEALIKNRIRTKCNMTIRLDRRDLSNLALIYSNVECNNRLNIHWGEIDKFTTDDFNTYQKQLKLICDMYIEDFKKGLYKEVNILTDRIILNKMNNCGAGDSHITFAPNGKFYICPGFYLDNDSPIGDLKSGLKLNNPQLYRLDHSPLCINCDAYQCIRCTYLNKRLTNEVNVPSHEQCVLAHLERNAGKYIYNALKEYHIPQFRSEIKEIDYLDPFDVLIK